MYYGYGILFSRLQKMLRLTFRWQKSHCYRALFCIFPNQNDKFGERVASHSTAFYENERSSKVVSRCWMNFLSYHSRFSIGKEAVEISITKLFIGIVRYTNAGIISSGCVDLVGASDPFLAVGRIRQFGKLETWNVQVVSNLYACI